MCREKDSILPRRSTFFILADLLRSFSLIRQINERWKKIISTAAQWLWSQIWFSGRMLFGGESADENHLSFFHSLWRLVLFLIRVIVRIFAVYFAGVSFSFNAVVVGVLRTDEGSVEWSTFYHDKKWTFETYAYWLLNDAWFERGEPGADCNTTSFNSCGELSWELSGKRFWLMFRALVWTRILTHETRRNWGWPWHPKRSSEALAASLSPLAVALINQLVLTHRINAPEASFSGFILRAWHFDEVAIQTEIMSNAETGDAL